MAYVFQRKNAPQRLSIKSPRTPLSAYLYAITTKNVITTVIIILAVLVVVTVLCSVLLNPERQVTRKFESLAHDYYENVFYPGMTNSDNYSGNPKASLEKYETIGLSAVTLRQLIYFTDASTADTDYLENHCDVNDSYVIFYPEPPYSKSSYRTSITYACNF